MKGTTNNLHFVLPRFFTVLLFSFCAFSAEAQFYQSRNYNVKDGLPSSEVYDILQDRKGFLWFSTDAGVSRFDGYEFKNFSTENGLADNSVFGLYEDAKERTWFRSLSGGLCYYSSGKLHSLPCNDTLEKLLKNYLITSLYVDAGDTIWAGTTKDMILSISPGWEKKNVTVKTLPAGGGYISSIDSSGFIFGGLFKSYFGIHLYKKFREEKYLAVNAKTDFTGSVRFLATRLHDGTFVATANSRLLHFDGARLLDTGSCHSIFICLHEDKSGTLFAGTYDGVLVYRKRAFRHPETIPHYENKIVTAICEDYENGLWFCTEGNGVFYVPYRNFMYYTPGDGLPESKISCVATVGNRVITGHLDGSMTMIRGQEVWSDRPLGDYSSSRTARISGLLALDSARIVAGTMTQLYTVGTDLGNATLFSSRGTKKLLRGQDGKILSISFREVFAYSTTSDENRKSIFSLSGYSDNLFQDHSGKLWICSANGLWRYDSISGTTFLGATDSLLASRVVDVQESPGGDIWMASRGNGVIVKRGNNLFHITQEDGLASNMCRCIFVDSDSVIWVGTNNGLNRIVIRDKHGFSRTISTYQSGNGLLTNEVNTILRMDDKLWLIHNNGISVFEPGRLRENINPPPVYITSVTAGSDTLSLRRKTELAHDQNYVVIRFIALSYKDPGKLEYKYKMEGVDSAWMYGKYTSVSYQTLPPGDYRFIVYAKNNDGYWSVKPSVIAFTILPAWWQTWWSRTIAALLLAGAGAVVFRARLKHVRRRDLKRAALQNKIAAAELKALRAQMNPHFVFNSINSVQYFITGNDPDSSQKYLSKFARLIRYVVDNSRLVSIPLRNEIEALRLYLDLEALRFGDRLEYSITVNENVDDAYVQIPSMLIQPYVENAIWHGIMHKKEKGRIDLVVEMKEQVLCCTIEDNGIGRKQAQLIRQEGNAGHVSVGMVNTRERIDIINQVNKSNLHVTITDLYDAGGLACGTKVEIRIPIN